VRARLVIAVAIIALAIGYFLGLWSDIAGWLTELWYFLAASTLVPNWLLALLAICAIIVAGLFGAFLSPRRESRDPQNNEPPPE